MRTRWQAVGAHLNLGARAGTAVVARAHRAQPAPASVAFNATSSTSEHPCLSIQKVL